MCVCGGDSTNVAKSSGYIPNMEHKDRHSKGFTTKGCISHFIESGLKERGQIMYYTGCCREGFLELGSGFTLCKVLSGVASHELQKIHTASLAVFRQNKNGHRVLRTFFFGRCTSSFIEAHLFKVLSRLKERPNKKETTG